MRLLCTSALLFLGIAATPPSGALPILVGDAAGDTSGGFPFFATPCPDPSAGPFDGCLLVAGRDAPGHMQVEADELFGGVLLGAGSTTGTLAVVDATLRLQGDPTGSQVPALWVGAGLGGEAANGVATLVDSTLILDSVGASPALGAVVEIASGPAATGRVVLTDSELRTLGAGQHGVAVGVHGHGELELLGSGIETHTLAIGVAAEGTGEVVLDNGWVQLSGDATRIEVGVAGTGTLDLDFGTLRGADEIIVGGEAGADGLLLLRGSIFESGDLVVGRLGRGRLESDLLPSIELDGRLVVGEGAGSTGEVQLGSFGSLVVAGGTHVGVGGKGSLRTDGTRLTSVGGLAIASGPASEGHVVLEPARSTDSISVGELSIGMTAGDTPDGGVGSLTVRNLVDVYTTRTRIGARGRLSGQLRLHGDVVNRGGVISPGDPVGRLYTIGPLVNEGGQLVFDVPSAERGAYDVLITDGLHVDGTAVEFRFVDGFAPKAGDRIAFTQNNLTGDVSEYRYMGALQGALFLIEPFVTELHFVALADFVADGDDDGVADTSDNCVGVPNPTQADVNAEADDDGSIPGIQHYGDACDADLDDDGVVGASDFFSHFAPCLGSPAPLAPACVPSDFDQDGAVTTADFFGTLRPAFGGAPGPGVTE